MGASLFGGGGLLGATSAGLSTLAGAAPKIGSALSGLAFFLGPSRSSGGGSDGVVATLRPTVAGSGWSLRYSGPTGGEMLAFLLGPDLAPASAAHSSFFSSAASSAAGSLPQLRPRTGCLALPRHQLDPDLAYATIGGGGSGSLVGVRSGQGQAPGRRRLTVWQPDRGSSASHDGHSASSLSSPAAMGPSAMVAQLARGDLEAMALFRCAAPMWAPAPAALESASARDPSTGRRFSSAAAVSSAPPGRFELPASRSAAFLQGPQGLAVASAKTLLLRSTEDGAACLQLCRLAASGGGGGGGGGDGDFAVDFAAPLSPLQAFAVACAAISSTAKGAPVHLEGAPWPHLVTSPSAIAQHGLPQPGHEQQLEQPSMAESCLSLPSTGSSLHRETQLWRDDHGEEDSRDESAAMVSGRRQTVSCCFTAGL